MMNTESTKPEDKATPKYEITTCGIDIANRVNIYGVWCKGDGSMKSAELIVTAVNEYASLKRIESQVKSMGELVLRLQADKAELVKNVEWLLETLKPFENMEALGPLESFKMREIESTLQNS